MKQTTAGAGGLRFGGVWTVVIVAQVAVTVVFPAVVWFENVQLGRMQDFNPGFATEQFLAVEVERDSSAESTSLVDAAIERDARMAATLEELRNRVAAEPGVGGVTFANALTGGQLPSGESSSATTPPKPPLAILRRPRRSAMRPWSRPTRRISASSTRPILAGRGFNAADAEPGAQVAIVDQAFVKNVLQGRNPIGQQVRFTRPTNPAGPGERYTVVGLVGNLDVGVPYRKGPFAGFYLPVTPIVLAPGSR